MKAFHMIDPTHNLLVTCCCEFVCTHCVCQRLPVYNLRQCQMLPVHVPSAHIVNDLFAVDMHV